jgi:hypothetical protein
MKINKLIYHLSIYIYIYIYIYARRIRVISFMQYATFYRLTCWITIVALYPNQNSKVHVHFLGMMPPWAPFSCSYELSDLFAWWPDKNYVSCAGCRKNVPELSSKKQQLKREVIMGVCVQCLIIVVIE